MKYQCKECNYETDDKSNWYKHKKSKKHIENSNKLLIMNPVESNKNPIESNKNLDKKECKPSKYICDICKLSYSTTSNLSKHRKKCLNENDNLLIKKLKDENKMLELSKQNEII